MKKVFLLFAFALILYGAISGDFAGVWQKATFICLECVGIG